MSQKCLRMELGFPGCLCEKKKDTYRLFNNNDVPHISSLLEDKVVERRVKDRNMKDNLTDMTIKIYRMVN